MKLSVILRKLKKVQSSRSFEFLGENDEEMDKNIVDNSYSYFTFVCGNVLFYRDASFHGVYSIGCNGVQREHNKKLNNGLPILHKVPPKRDYGRYFCIMAEKGGTSHGGLTEKLSPFFHAKKQEVNAYGR